MLFKLLLAYLAVGYLLTACTDQVSESLGSKGNSAVVSEFSITSVQIKDKALIIKGSKLDKITKVALEGVAQDFQIDSQSAEEMQVSVSSSLKLIAYKAYSLTLSSATEETTAPVVLITLTLDTYGAGTGQVLQFNSSTQAWQPGDLNGLHFMGSWNPSTNTNPNIVSGGYSSGSPPQAGDYYIVSTAASITAIDTFTDWAVGDWIIFSSNGMWQKLTSEASVKSFK